MSNGFGAAFGGLLLLAVLTVMAGLLGLFLAGAIVSQRWTGTVPSVLRYLAVALVLGVVLVAGFAVVALVDEAATLAGVFFGIVFVPLGAVVVYLDRIAELPLHDTVATAGFAWSIPFLLGLAVTFVVPTVINKAIDLAPAESQQLGLYWMAATLGTTVVVLGALWLGKHVGNLLYFATTHR